MRKPCHWIPTPFARSVLLSSKQHVAAGAVLLLLCTLDAQLDNGSADQCAGDNNDNRQASDLLQYALQPSPGATASYRGPMLHPDDGGALRFMLTRMLTIAGKYNEASPPARCCPPGCCAALPNHAHVLCHLTIILSLLL